MKHYNEKHEATITTYLNQPDKGNDGEVVPHEVAVNDISFYEYLDNNKYKKITLNKDFILDLAEQIKKIESQKVEAVYKNLPF